MKEKSQDFITCLNLIKSTIEFDKKISNANRICENKSANSNVDDK